VFLDLEDPVFVLGKALEVLPAGHFIDVERVFNLLHCNAFALGLLVVE
jgi:hypothetical protein